MSAKLLARSSEGGSYVVEFTEIDGTLRVICHCQAGTLQQMCKHKLALLKGDSGMLHDQSQTAELSRILSSPEYAALKPRLDRYETEVAGVTVQMAALK